MDAIPATGNQAPAPTTELPELKSPIVAAIEAATEAAQTEQERTYIGASVLGHACERRLWYGFRWVHAPERLDARKLRIFATGHMEETRLIAELRAAGVIVSDVNPNTNDQWGVVFANGHAAGHADGRCTGVPGAEKTEHILECKSHGDKSFKALKKDGVEKGAPAHYAQVQIYMHGLALTRCLYLAVNKNDDELYAERIKYDADTALRLVAKAERIVAAHQAPSKLHDDPNAKMAWTCRYCPALGVCHQGEFARRNCRTCLHSTPVADGGWFCGLHNEPLTIEAQRAGCGSHLYLPSLVPFEQVDAAEQDGAIAAVTYRQPDGSPWHDGAPV
jgi:hypothetical protein